MAYEHITDEDLDDIFKDLDFNQLREMGYYLIDEISDQEELEDFLAAIEEDFSELSRQEKIEELGGQVIEAYGDYRESTEGFDVESKKKKLTQKQKEEKQIEDAIHDVDDMRDFYAERRDGGPPHSVNPVQLKKKDRWTPGKGIGEIPRFAPPAGGPTVIKPKYLKKKDFGVDAYDEQMTIWICRACNRRYEDQNDAEVCCEGLEEGEIPYFDGRSKEMREVYLHEAESNPSYGEEEAAKDPALKKLLMSMMPTGVHKCDLCPWQGDLDDFNYHIAYDCPGTISHRAMLVNAYESNFGAESFEADSPFNTMLLIRDDVIIDQEDNFEYLLSIFMELENDLRELEESGSQKHPFYEEMHRYRILIADRLDELQQEVKVEPSIEMDAESFLLEKPASTGFLFGLGVIGSTLVGTLAMGLVAAWFVNEE